MKNKRIIIAIIATLVTINIILITPFGKNIAYQIANSGNGVISFFQKGFNNFVGYLTDNKELRKDNQILQHQNSTLTDTQERTISENDVLASDNQQLLDQLQGNQEIQASMKNFSSSGEIINGQIILRNVNQWNETAEINLGSNHGNLKVGQAVVNNGILIGHITEVHDNSSTIQLLSIPNKNLNIPALGINNGKQYNVIIDTYDQSENTYLIHEVNPSSTQQLNVGDNIYTNGYGENTVKGIKIGTITEVVNDNKTGQVAYKVEIPIQIVNATYVGVVLNA